MFTFINGAAGGTDLIQNFAGGDKVILEGYGANAITQALDSAVVANGSITLTLSDQTKVTFAGVTTLNRNDFITAGELPRPGRGLF